MRHEGKALQDDKELAAQAADGDIDAFGGLFERYAREIYRLALSLGHRRPEAEDLMQDTFLAALEGIGRFEGRSSFRTWLTAIAFRQSSRHRRYRALRIMEPFDETSPETAGALRASGRHERQLDVHAMLDTLSEEHRAVLVLRELQGLSYDEIARVLKIPRGTVESRLFRARHVLRERFEEYTTVRAKPRHAVGIEPVEIRHE
jgi:RNA polymerase sigma-70 factor (ECF subfamily)